MSRHALRTAILNIDARRSSMEAGTFNALGAVLHDLASELRACMKDADSGTDDPQYVVKVDIIGDRRIGSLVNHVSVQRIAELHSDGSLALVPTLAEKCIAEILELVELPREPIH